MFISSALIKLGYNLQSSESLAQSGYSNDWSQLQQQQQQTQQQQQQQQPPQLQQQTLNNSVSNNYPPTYGNEWQNSEQSALMPGYSQPEVSGWNPTSNSEWQTDPSQQTQQQQQSPSEDYSPDGGSSVNYWETRAALASHEVK